MATKEQERTALEKIRGIIEALGEDSCIGKAFEGCFEIAEENIAHDFWCSMKDRAEAAEKKLKCAEMDLKSYKLENKALAQALEFEQEWSEYESEHSICQSKYSELANNEHTHCMTDDEAKNILYDWFGFAKEKVTILYDAPKYEINRHKRLRKIGTVERKPLYNATDWNYIQFECGGVCYEMYNDDLYFAY